MWNLSYTACSFVIKEKYKSQKYTDLHGDFVEIERKCNHYHGVIEVFQEYFRRNEKLYDNTDEKRLFKMSLVSRGAAEKMDYLLVEIESGRYGYKSNITDKETRKVKYQQKETEAPLMKFYLAIIIPKAIKGKMTHKGFMFFQNYGQFGVKTDTTHGMKHFFSTTFDEMLWIGNISPEIFVETMLSSESIRKVCLVRNNISFDESDNLRFAYGKEQRVLEKVRLSETFISRLQGYLAGGNRIFEFESKEYDDVKLGIDIGGRERIIGLNNIENVSIIESLPDDLKNKNGDIITERYISIVCNQAKEYMKRVICYR